MLSCPKNRARGKRAIAALTARETRRLSFAELDGYGGDYPGL
jgi:hypothetical protein